MRYETSIIIKQKSNKFAKNPCNYCGDGVIGGTEECDGETNKDVLCQGVTKTHYSNIWDFESSTSPYGRPATITESVNGKYTISSDYYDHSSYPNACTNTGSVIYDVYLGTSSGRQIYECYYNKGASSSGTGWKRTTIDGHNAYCAQNTGSGNTVAELSLNVTTTKAGSVSFNFYGESEKYYDRLVVFLDNSFMFTWHGTGTYKDWAWTATISGVSAGNHTLKFLYLKDSGTAEGIDKFCIDNLAIPGPATNPSNISCNSSCQKAGTCYSYCGDGTKDAAEVCDSGSNNNDSWTQQQHCRTNCSGWAPYCGDGAVESGKENCDTGESSTATCVKRASSTNSCGCRGSCYKWRIYTLTCNSCSSHSLSINEEKEVDSSKTDPSEIGYHWCSEYASGESNTY